MSDEGHVDTPLIVMVSVGSSSNKVPELLVESIMDHKLSNKRKFMDSFAEQEGLKKLKPAPSLHSGELQQQQQQLETPPPLDRQPCLDIRSGKVHFYSTRSPEVARTRPDHMRLDLELNLPGDNSAEPLRSDLSNYSSGEDQLPQSCDDLLLNFGSESKDKIINPTSQMSSSSTSTARSWLPFEGDEKSEMVATVCKRCFMLVMLCKAAPACPNCKFMHNPHRRLTHLLY